MIGHNADIISEPIITDQIKSIRKSVIREATKQIKKGTMSGEGIIFALPAIDAKLRPLLSQIRQAFSSNSADAIGRYEKVKGAVRAQMESLNSDMKDLDIAWSSYVQAAKEAGVEISDTERVNIDYSDLAGRFEDIDKLGEKYMNKSMEDKND